MKCKCWPIYALSEWSFLVVMTARFYQRAGCFERFFIAEQISKSILCKGGLIMKILNITKSVLGCAVSLFLDDARGSR